jgi:hypothetical protein
MDDFKKLQEQYKNLQSLCAYQKNEIAQLKEQTKPSLPQVLESLGKKEKICYQEKMKFLKPDFTKIAILN